MSGGIAGIGMGFEIDISFDREMMHGLEITEERITELADIAIEAAKFSPREYDQIQYLASKVMPGPKGEPPSDPDERARWETARDKAKYELIIASRVFWQVRKIMADGREMAGHIMRGLGPGFGP